MDWKDSLSSLLASGNLPEGPEENINVNDKSDDSPKSVGTVNVIYERKGRGGKPATILECRDLDPEQTALLARRLKSALAVGGSARDKEILLQGDQRNDRLKNLLTKEGFRIKGI